MKLNSPKVVLSPILLLLLVCASLRIYAQDLGNNTDLQETLLTMSLSSMTVANQDGTLDSGIIITQYGLYNYTSAFQSDSIENAIKVMQVGINNNAEISQFGINNRVRLIQEGENNLFYSLQDGNNNTINVKQFGSNREFSVTQLGDDMIVNITQFGN